jgi:5,10-methylenetetrahydromethanopterin reductase
MTTQIGIITFPSPGGSADMARMVEELGFDSLGYADTQNLTPEVWGQLMLAAGATERMELGTSVTNPISRDVAVTASAAMALQLESGGRAVCGIGRGDSSMAKIGRRPASVSVFENYLERLRAYLRGAVVDRDGEPSYLEWLKELDLEPPPIDVAATGPKVIGVAARHADRITFAVGALPERIAEARDFARKEAAAAGRDPSALRFGAYINSVINPDRAVARDAARGTVSVLAHFSGFRGMDLEGLPEQMRATAAHLREHYDMRNHGVAAGAHAQALDDEFLDWFGIVGPLEEARVRFAALADLELDFLRVIPGSRDTPPAVVSESLRLLATEIAPEVRRPR